MDLFYLKQQFPIVCIAHGGKERKCVMMDMYI